MTVQPFFDQRALLGLLRVENLLGRPTACVRNNSPTSSETWRRTPIYFTTSSTCARRAGARVMPSDAAVVAFSVGIVFCPNCER